MTGDGTYKVTKNLKLAGAELGQAQPQLGLWFDWNWIGQGQNQSD